MRISLLRHFLLMEIFALFNFSALSLGTITLLHFLHFHVSQAIHTRLPFQLLSFSPSPARIDWDANLNDLFRIQFQEKRQRNCCSSFQRVRVSFRREQTHKTNNHTYRKHIKYIYTHERASSAQYGWLCCNSMPNLIHKICEDFVNILLGFLVAVAVIRIWLCLGTRCFVYFHSQALWRSRGVSACEQHFAFICWRSLEKLARTKHQ